MDFLQVFDGTFDLTFAYIFRRPIRLAQYFCGHDSFCISQTALLICVIHYAAFI